MRSRPTTLILCNENVWDTNTQAETNFFCRFAGRELRAQMPGIELPSGHGTLYAYRTFTGDYGGYDLAWCGRLTDDTGEVMDGMRVYVQGALVPDNAVIKYKVRLADGTEETRRVPACWTATAPPAMRRASTSPRWRTPPS